jgi:hypothetical protein
LLSSVCSLVPWLAPRVVHVISLGISNTVGLGAPAGLRLLPWLPPPKMPVPCAWPGCLPGR